MSLVSNCEFNPKYSFSLSCKYPWALKQGRLYSKFTARNLIFKIHEFPNCFFLELPHFSSFELITKAVILLNLILLLIDQVKRDKFCKM